MKRVWHVVLLTSAVWFLLDACLLLYFMSAPALPATNDVPQHLAVKLVPPANGEGVGNAGPPGVDNPKFAGNLDALKGDIQPPASVDDSLLGRLMNGLRLSPGGPGENGRPVKIDKSKEEEMKTKFKINQFNLMASDMISLNRSLPDVRNSRCRSKRFDTEELPTTSVIMVFHNEAWSTLLRSIHSVINRSPRRLLHEIILIDDASEREHLREPLESYIKTLPVKTILRHLTNRSGLVKARLHGAKLASARTMTYLDAHIEVTKGWLEPLMERIAGDRTRVVCPVIDVISDDTFEYVTASDSTWGGFNWKLQFRWFTGPHGDREDKSIPIKSPAMAGGLFAIERDYFYEIGSYDEGMLIWGGENLEMSFRIWQCGGTVEIVPCSHVGHVFRKQTPYTFPGGTSHVIHHNSLRTTDVWMEDYRHFFYKVMPGVQNVDKGDISARLQFKKDKKCKSFRWYLEHIYPEAHIPAQYWSLGEIRNPSTKICIDTMSEKAGSPGKASACHGLGGNQAWTLGVHGLIRADDMCLEAVRSAVKMVMCDYGKESHKWQYVENLQQLRNRDTGTCLTLNKESGNLLLAKCDSVNELQLWSLEGYSGTLKGGPAE